MSGQGELTRLGLRPGARIASTVVRASCGTSTSSCMTPPINSYLCSNCNAKPAQDQGFHQSIQQVETPRQSSGNKRQQPLDKLGDRGPT